MTSTSGPFVFTGPQLVRRSDATRFLWGDQDSHQVADLIYGRGSRISAVTYALQPGEYFRASQTWKPLYDQHRFYYVVKGSLAIHDPESGEVAVAAPGEAITWRGSRYHFGYNFGTEETLVLDWFAPPERPTDVPEVSLAATKRGLKGTRGGRFELLGAWPDSLPEAQRQSLQSGGVGRVAPADALHLVYGEHAPMLVSVMTSSADLTAGTLSLRPGLMSEPETHPGDEVVFALEGNLHVYLPDNDDWFELAPLDCAFIPEGTPHQYCSYGDSVSVAAFCVAPGYR